MNTKKRKPSLQELSEKRAASLGLLPDSRTYRKFCTGEINEKAAKGIGRYTRHRHEYTNYDDLLANGVPKEKARELIKPKKKRYKEKGKKHVVCTRM